MSKILNLTGQAINIMLGHYEEGNEPLITFMPEPYVAHQKWAWDDLAPIVVDGVSIPVVENGEREVRGLEEWPQWLEPDTFYIVSRTLAVMYRCPQVLYPFDPVHLFGEDVIIGYTALARG